MFVRGDAVRLPFADKTFDLCVGSPPYLEARLYLEDGEDKEIARGCFSWVKWMLRVTIEVLRVTKGPVIWVVAGTTKDYNYQPGPEGLLWEWWKRGGDCHCLRPVYWNRDGVPGSGRDYWYRSSVEYCLCFKRKGKPVYANPKANGYPPKERITNTTTPRYKKDRSLQYYKSPDIVNPGNFFKTNSGGGCLGHKMAHDNEAPFPTEVPKFFINSHCPPGGLVLDPFSGSGTTVHAAVELGRRGVGLDLRQSQCLLSRKRVRTVTPGFQFSE